MSVCESCRGSPAETNVTGRSRFGSIPFTRMTACQRGRGSRIRLASKSERMDSTVSAALWPVVSACRLHVMRISPHCRLARLLADLPHGVRAAGFSSVLARKIRQGTALAAASDDGTSLLGGLLFTAKPPAYHVRWLVVSAQVRGNGIGRALMADAMRRFVTAPGMIEVVTFGADHPGAAASGARLFYERLGFVPGEAASPGPEGGSGRSTVKPLAD